MAATPGRGRPRRARLPLGSDTYDDVRASLVARLAEHDAHRDIAFSVVGSGTDR